MQYVAPFFFFFLAFLKSVFLKLIKKTKHICFVVRFFLLQEAQQVHFLHPHTFQANQVIGNVASSSNDGIDGF